MDCCLQWIDRINLAAHRLAGFLCVILVLITFEQVAARYLFAGGSIAMQELQWHSLGFIIWLSSAWVWRCDQHVRVDIVYSRCSVRRKAWINIVGIILFSIPMCLLLMVTGWEYAMRSYRFTDTSLTDAWTRTWFTSDSTWYEWAATVEAGLRSTILAGETSPDAGGLPSRWFLKAMIPVGACLLLLQAIAELLKSSLTLRRQNIDAAKSSEVSA